MTQSPPLREVVVGRFRIRVMPDRLFALDGGAMFGVVPRLLWEKLTPVHDDHTIPLATNAFLVEDEEHKVLIEPGLGDRWGAKERAMFHIDVSSGGVLNSLQEAGVAASDITHVIMSHCHWDHIGAVCDEGAPRFTQAQHWAPQIEIDAALNPDHLRRASYRKEDIQPVVDAGLLHGIVGSKEIIPGIRLIEVGGHSDGVSLIMIEDQGETACFWADVVPTRNHVHLPFIMAYDMNAEKSFAVRSEWIPKAAKQGWWNLLYHDPETPIVQFQTDGRRFTT